MASVRTLTIASIAVSVALVLLSVFTLDFFWTIVAALNIIMVGMPASRGLDRRYSKTLILATIIPPMVELAFLTTDYYTAVLGQKIWIDVPADRYVSSAVMSVSGFLSGLMLLTAMAQYSVMRVTKRWVILFAMMFALMLSVVNLFFEFTYMYIQGMPVFNSEVASDSFNNFSNNLMMVSPFVFTFTTAVMALVTTRIMRNRTLDDLMPEVAA